MGLMSSFQISAAGMAVQQKRMDVASENLANIDSTRSPEGGPYKKKMVMVSSSPFSFDATLGKLMDKNDVQSVEVVGVEKSTRPPRTVFNPSHPDADKEGNVAMPDVSSIEEMIDMMTASKSYEANITTLNAAKTMILRTLDIGGV